VYDKNLYKIDPGLAVYTVRTRLQNALSTPSPSVHHTHNNNNNIETVGVFDVPGTPITNQSTRQTSLVKEYTTSLYTYKYTINILYTLFVCVCVYMCVGICVYGCNAIR